MVRTRQIWHNQEMNIYIYMFEVPGFVNGHAYKGAQEKNYVIKVKDRKFFSVLRFKLMKFLFHHLICQSCHVISLAGSEPPVLGTRAHHSKSTTNKLYDNVQRTTPAVFIATRKCCKHPSIETLDSEQVSASTSAKMATRVIWCALPRWLVQFPLWLER